MLLETSAQRCKVYFLLNKRIHIQCHSPSGERAELLRVFTALYDHRLSVMQGGQGSDEEMEVMISESSTPRLRRCGYCLLKVTSRQRLPHKNLDPVLHRAKQKSHFTSSLLEGKFFFLFLC